MREVRPRRKKPADNADNILASIAGQELNVWERVKIQSYGYAAALHILECDSAAVALDFRSSKPSENRCDSSYGSFRGRAVAGRQRERAIANLRPMSSEPCHAPAGSVVARSRQMEWLCDVFRGRWDGVGFRQC